jgi:hypothetical protein
VKYFDIGVVGEVPMNEKLSAMQEFAAEKSNSAGATRRNKRVISPFIG